MARGRRRNTKVRFERLTNVEQPGGGRGEDWVPVCTLWAFVERVKSLRDDVEHVTQGGNRATPLLRIEIDSTALSRTITNADRAIIVKTNTEVNINFVQDMTGLDRVLTVTGTENLTS